MPNDALDWIDDAMRELESQQLRRRPLVRDGQQSARIVLDGDRLWNFGSNDYLGLASDPRLIRAVADHAESCGWGSGASPLVMGRGRTHVELERQLARFEDTEAALLFSSGFAANVGTIAALVGPGDLVLSDAKNHASIIDGCRLARARVEVYRHGDADHARASLRDHTGYRRRLIVTDGLFSMDGDVAPLHALAELARQHDAMLMVDEAHATGVFGRHGRGVSEHLDVESGVHVRVGTLSKALGSLGGFVVGRRRLIDWLGHRARSYVFSTAPPEAMCAAALAALKIVRDEPQRRERLLDRAGHLRQRLRSAGWQTGSSCSQIVPVRIGDPSRTMQIADRLRHAGYVVPGIRPPSVPQGESLLRISVCHGHDERQLEGLVHELTRVGGPG